LTPKRTSRPICQKTIGTEYSSLRSEHGTLAIRRIPMCGVTGTCIDPSPTEGTTHAIFSSEIKFGALLDHLPEDTEFLATGLSSLLSPTFGPYV
jgi:hypothetical protein